jgi:hypothetical protein
MSRFTYPSGPSYSTLVFVQFQNWNLNQVSFLELDGTEIKLGMGGGGGGGVMELAWNHFLIMALQVLRIIIE